MAAGKKSFPGRCFVWLFRLGLWGILVLLGTAGLYFLLRSKPSERQEIYQGVFHSVEDFYDPVGGDGRVTIVEVHWETPGVEFFIRQPDLLDNGNPDQHYTLTLPTVEIIKHDLAAFINLTRYYPDDVLKSYPGAKVGTVETIVIDGVYTHVHEHSYMLRWDENMVFHFDTHKPPRVEDLQRAKMGFGVQGVQIHERKINGFTLSGWDSTAVNRTFIGLDTEKKVLWLFAFENVTPAFMTQYAAGKGLVHGAQVDSGNGTHLLLGSGAKGLLPFSGVRSGRPLGAYIGVKANPLE